MRIPSYLVLALVAAVFLVLVAPASAAENGTTSTAATGDQQFGYLQINTTPGGATVFVNKTKMNGVTPLTIKVPAMVPQDLVISKYGYVTEKKTLIAPPAGTIPYSVSLRTLPGVDRPEETETAGAKGTPTEPAGSTTERIRTNAAPTAEGAYTETPLSPIVVILAIAGAGVLIARRR
jgi:hypothetical protein